MDSKVQNDKQTAIFAACDEMLREGMPVNKINSRQVSARVEWSHTTVAPYLKAWREQRAKKEREAVQQTQMSTNFVKALHVEVEDRINRLRAVDAEQYELLSSEHSDLVEANLGLENQIDETKANLSRRTEEATQQRALAAQNLKDLEAAQKSHKAEVKELNQRYEHDTKELKGSLTASQQKWDSERAEQKDEHREEIRKLTEKKDELHLELQDKTAKLAEAAVKTENYAKVSEELEQSKSTITALTAENLRYKAELDSKTDALAAAGKSLDDNITQRDKAQSDAAMSEQELRSLNEKYNNLLALALEAGVTMDQVRAMS